MEKKEKLVENLGSHARTMEDQVKSLKNLISLSSYIEVQTKQREGTPY
jgi:hypothetical protein